MRAPALAALGIAAYVVFLVARIPASFVLARMQAAEPGKFEVLQAIGTVWMGNASVSLNTPGGPVVIDYIDWIWRPQRLFEGRLAFDISATANGMAVHYEGGRSFTRWEVRNLTANGSASRMSTIVPWLGPFAPEGQVTITSPQLSATATELRGPVRIEWKGAAVALSEVRPLGSYRADIEAEGNAGKVTVSTLEGSLRIAGTGTLTPPARFAFNGEARAEGPQAAALEPLLSRMGPRRPDGAQSLAWRLN